MHPESRTQVKYPIKKPTPYGMGFLIGSLVVSYFRTVYLALSSALRRFTVLFGMGRRGTTSLLPPGKAVFLILNNTEEVLDLSIACSASPLARYRVSIHKAIGSSHTGN